MKEGITSGKNRKDPTLISYKSKRAKRFLWSPLRSPLVEYEELEKAVTHEWILSTSKVKELIGVTPRVGKDEMTFVWGSFTFTKAGKVSNQIGWLVSKT
jgi:hypothetical protein